MHTRSIEEMLRLMEGATSSAKNTEMGLPIIPSAKDFLIAVERAREGSKRKCLEAGRHMAIRNDATTNGSGMLRRKRGDVREASRNFVPVPVPMAVPMAGAESRVRELKVGCTEIQVQV